MEFFLRLWRGKVGLGLTFGVFGVFFLAVFYSFELAGKNISQHAGQMAYLASLAYFTFYTVILWRAAAQETTEIRHAALMRAFIFVGWGRYLISAYMLGGTATGV